jgi:3alpha(or 20beta)-hydroxysteroid dehydrogenase
MGLLDGKVAIISGAAQGQGAAEARLFAAEGAAVVVGDIQDELGWMTAHAIGAGALFHHLDVRVPEDWQAAVAAAERTFGAVTVLINNAGMKGQSGGIRSETLVNFRRVVEVNQIGPVLGIQAVIPSMLRAGGGAIVNVSSTGGMWGVRGSVAYGSTKWALRGLTKAIALELAPAIRVNSLHPGPVDTPMLHDSDLSDEEFQSRWSAVVPLGRAAGPDMIAEAAAFLSSDRASYITGTELVVDGGLTAGWHQAPAWALGSSANG